MSNMVFFFHCRMEREDHLWRSPNLKPMEIITTILQLSGIIGTLTIGASRS